MSTEAQIVGILRRIADSRQPITVTTPLDRTQHTSAVLDVNAERRFVLLDELNPQPANDGALEGKRLGVFAQLEGVDVSFASRIARVGHQDGIAYYLLALPDSVVYQQRREHYRAPASSADPIDVEVGFNGAKGPLVKGELADISIGGLGVRFEGGSGVPDGLERGTPIPYCRVHLPGQRNPLECKSEIRSIRHDGQRLQLGTRFVELDPRSHRQVEKFVASLDREQRRRGG